MDPLDEQYVLPPSGEIMQRQLEENISLQAQLNARRLGNINMSRCIREATDTTAGLVDLTWHQGGQKDLLGFLSTSDHMRGLGLILVALASSLLLVDVILA